MAGGPLMLPQRWHSQGVVPVTGRWLNGLRDFVARLQNISFVGGTVLNTEHGIALGVRPGGAPQPSVGAELMAKITGSILWSPVTANHWKYAWVEVGLNGATIPNKENGRSGSTSDNWAINGSEFGNTNSRGGVQSDGVNQSGANYPAGYVAGQYPHKYFNPIKATADLDIKNGAKVGK